MLMNPDGLDRKNVLTRNRSSEIYYVYYHAENIKIPAMILL